MALSTWMCLAGSAKAFHTGQTAAGPVPVRSPAQIQIRSLFLCSTTHPPSGQHLSHTRTVGSGCLVD